MISGKAKLAGVMGWPVSHSRSPVLHNTWLAHHGIDGAYLPFPVRPENLTIALRALPTLGIRGVNLTVPHKEMALGVVDALSDTARGIGAVNTVVVREDGMLFGDNTDAYGFAENLRADGKLPARLETAVVLGAGGAARAVIAALNTLGVTRILLLNRTLARAQALAASPYFRGVRAVEWDARAEVLADADLLVNTTTQGMHGEPALDLDLHALPPEALVTDIVYTPIETPLLAHARARGNPVTDGLGMLLHQAVPGFEAWFGVRPTVTEALRAAVQAA